MFFIQKLELVKNQRFMSMAVVQKHVQGDTWLTDTLTFLNLQHSV